MKGRCAPPSKEQERVAALVGLDISAMREWARRYAVGLLGNDHTVLISIHEARVLDPVIRDEDRQISVAWLTEHCPGSTALREAA